MRVKFEHILIVIIILIGLHLLMNRCRCNGFSVGIPEYRFQSNCSDSTDYNFLTNYIDDDDDESPSSVDRVDGSVIYQKNDEGIKYIYIWFEDIVEEQDDRERKCKEYTVPVNLSELFLPTVKEGEDTGVEETIPLHVLKQIFEEDFCSSYKAYGAMLIAQPRLKKYEEDIKQHILELYDHINEDYAGQTLTDIAKKECMPKEFSVKAMWRVGWRDRKIVIYHDRLIIQKLDNTVEYTIPFNKEGLSITGELSYVCTDPHSYYPIVMDEPLCYIITIETDIFNKHGGQVTITCSKHEPTYDELQCTHNIFNILIKNKRKITGRGGPPA